MDKTKKVLTDIHSELVNESIKENLKAQQEAMDKSWRQDCRRTAIQLASRSNTLVQTGMLKDADEIYKWLVEPDNTTDRK